MKRVAVAVGLLLGMTGQAPLGLSRVMLFGRPVFAQTAPSKQAVVDTSAGTFIIDVTPEDEQQSNDETAQQVDGGRKVDVWVPGNSLRVSILPISL